MPSSRGFDTGLPCYCPPRIASGDRRGECRRVRGRDDSGAAVAMRAWLAGVLTVALLASGCGSSDDSPKTDAPPAAREEAPDLERLPPAEKPTGPAPGADARDPEAFVRDVFDDIEA